ncbi:signal peptidase I SipW [Ornithinibacillus bavariensis]|uniref:Signal peptidase I n=1 Tax=Ornithinibacillus bavariensis TaxID=545502 RepID=A0A919X649_9BACI|nr:signal peptidase I [Ornithinibacillus bavariensis]GIO26449.1 S26 family signal peptidase [Ornithinibacillus bavariensis]HAM81670.1 signal peptidase I [Ornithinibacillus sp.]
MNKKKVFKWFNNILTGMLFLLLVIVGSMVLVTKLSGGEPQIFGYQLKTVLSGSMEPGIQTGSIIAVKPGGDMTRFKENDVITYKESNGKLITHRIIEVIHSGDKVLYRTKGDNNNTADINPILSENVVAEYTGITIPFAGYFTNFAQSKNGAFLLLIPGIVIFLFSIISIWRTLASLNTYGNPKDKTNKEELASKV